MNQNQRMLHQRPPRIMVNISELSLQVHSSTTSNFLAGFHAIASLILLQPEILYKAKAGTHLIILK